MKTPLSKNLISRWSWQYGLLLITLVCFATALTSQAQNTNTMTGAGALMSDKGPKDGQRNTADGYESLTKNTTGTDNSAVGYESLFSNTNGVANTATGSGALQNNTTGSTNTAIGFQALYHALTSSTPDENGSTVGDSNTAVGYQSLFSNTTGFANAAYGLGALSSNTTGFLNAAMGRTALFNNTTGRRNAAVGNGALYLNTIGNLNTAAGHSALENNTTGNQNIALGDSAGRNIINGSSNIDIGYPRSCDGCTETTGPDESNTIRIGDPTLQNATFIAGIYGEPTSDAGSTTPVVIDMNGNLGTTASSERFKRDVKPMDKSSDVILALKPVTFQYKNDSKDTPQFGLVAEEVAKVNPNLVVRDAKGSIYTVRYDAVNAMLLNEFLKEHKKVEQLEKQIETLTAGLHKVSAQVELNKPSPQMAVNSP